MNQSTPSDFASLPHLDQARLDRVCDTYESELKAGCDVSIEQLLEEVDEPSREVLFAELLALEIHHGESSGQTVDAKEYEARFPQYWGLIRRAFAGAQELFSPGARIGDFEVRHQIGAGGMGVVYEARDVKLERCVALKVLPSVFANHPERLKRFEREAKVLASLSHPNIATLYGFEEHQGIRFFVLELVPGQTLAEMIHRRPLPPDDVRTVFGQIATALEAAHAQGIVHRDLKPANVMVTPDGKVKVLDFGLAASLPLVGPAQDMDTPPGSVSDTSAVASAVAGTVPYMSPEQARGKRVDKRTDVWAFGCCLYEALTGRRAFAGEAATEVLAAIVGSEPDWDALPRRTPPSVRLVVRRCLQKDPDRRLRDLGDAWLDDAYVDGLASASGTGSRSANDGFWKWVAPCLVAAVVATVVIWSSRLLPHRADLPTRMLHLNLPSTEPIAVAGSAPLGEGRPSIALLPDGSGMIYVADIDGVPKLCLRPLDLRLERTVIEGTQWAYNPFVSPDGQWVGFFSSADEKLKIVSLQGGQPVSLCDASYTFGASWGEDGYIYFTDFGRVWRVFHQGGATEQVVSREGYFWPEVLPEGKGILLSRRDHGIVRVSPTGEEELVLARGTDARYVPSGHLVYALPDSAQLMAVPFDLGRAKIAGAPVPVVEHVRTENRGCAQFSFACDGSMVYIPGRSAALGTLVRVTPGKEEESLGFPLGFYGTFQIAPDGRRIAIEIRETKTDVWVFDLERMTQTRLTSEGNNSHPIWTPDGQAVVFRSDRNGKWDLFRKPVDRSGDVENLTANSRAQVAYALDWSADGKWLAFYSFSDDNIMMLSLDKKEVRSLVPTKGSGLLTFSPDGRWIAYTVWGRGDHVWMQPFPGPGHRQQVSIEAGEEPVWSPAGDRLYYRNRQEWMAVAVETQPELKLGTPELLFAGDYLNVSGRSYDITPDGKHFILLRREEDPAPTQVHLVENWFDELRRLAPPKGK